MIKKAAASAVVLLVLIVTAVFAEFLMPHDPNAMGYEMMVAPSISHLLGTDDLSLRVEADTPTWGLILSESRSFISRAWWVGAFPGLAIMITVLSINFLGDALRDILDVREGKEVMR